MGKVSTTLGAAGEDQGRAALARAGVNQVERVGTPVKLVAVSPAFTKRGIFKVDFGERVAADYRGVLTGGRSVLAEVKTGFGRNLTWSDLRPHQPQALTDHAFHGGLSLLVWVTDNGVHILKWPIPGFKKGKGLTPERAQELALDHRDLIQNEKAL